MNLHPTAALKKEPHSSALWESQKPTTGTDDDLFTGRVLWLFLHCIVHCLVQFSPLLEDEWIFGMSSFFPQVIIGNKEIQNWDNKKIISIDCIVALIAVDLLAKGLMVANYTKKKRNTSVGCFAAKVSYRFGWLIVGMLSVWPWKKIVI